MARYRSRSRSRSYSPVRPKRYNDPRERHRDSSRSYRDRRSPAPSGLLVRNISLDARPEDLRTPFERFGPIKDVYLPKNYHTGEPRGFGFVKFRYAEDAAEAKQHLNHAIIGGREIKIVFAEENRKTPQEMRRVTCVSSRGSYRRRSLSRSPSRRYRSYSRSASPARLDLRDYGIKENYYSPRRSRSISRSVSPRSDRDYRSEQRSSRRSRSHRAASRSPSPRENGRSAHNNDHAPSRSPSPRGNAQSPSRSRSQSDSPR